MLATSEAELTEEHLARLREEFPLYAATNLWIRTKPEPGRASRLITLELNTAQRYVDAKVEHQKASTGRIRAIVLKARQEGISTYVGARIYHGCTLWQRRRGMVLADDLERTAEIFAIPERFERYGDPALRPPRVTSRRARELAWASDSRLTVETARDRDTGRGSTLDYVHASEFASWPYPADTLAGLIDAVPEDAGEIWIESTAKGVGNEFHAMWEAAVAGESEWLPIFLPWWIEERYRVELSVKARKELLATLDAFEREALREGIAWDEPGEDLPPVLPSGARWRPRTKTWVLTAEQLAWRRRKIRIRDERTFRQENPATADEAFLVSGAAYFDPDALRQMLKRRRPPRDRGAFIAVGGGFGWSRDERGHVRIWEDPDPDGHYVIGADTAEGKLAAGTISLLSESESERGGRDFCSADILKVSELVDDPRRKGVKLRIPTLRQVGQIHGRMPPEVFAEQLFAASAWWSCPAVPGGGRARQPCLTGVERNHDSGQTAIRELRERWRHPALYIHRRMNTRTGKATREFGWITDGTTRMPMLDDAGRHVREGTIDIASGDTLREMLTFVRGEASPYRPAAQEGAHDDRVISLAIGVQMARFHSDGPQAQAASEDDSDDDVTT